MLRVFLSSTSEDLKVFRRVAIHAIEESPDRKAECMERFLPGSQPTVDQCRDLVRQCDLLLLIIAFRFGSAAPGGDESYTMHELNAARECGIPCLALMAGPKWRGDLWEKDQVLRTRVENLRSSWGSVAKFFDDENRLADDPRELPIFHHLVEDTIRGHARSVEVLRDQLVLNDSKLKPGETLRVREVFEQLRQCLAGGAMLAHAPQIRAAFQKVYPGGAAQLHERDGVRMFVEAVRALAALPPRSGDGIHPLPVFLLSLADAVGGERGRLLRGCAGDGVPALAVHDIAAPRSDPFPESAAQKSFRVTVRVKPAQMKKNVLEVQAFIHQQHTSVQLSLEHNLWAEKQSELSVRLDELVAAISDARPDRDPDLIEFVVPIEFINKDFDQWKITSTLWGTTGRLGERFPVVVRFSARKHAEPSKEHRRRWQHLRLEAEAAICTAEEWSGRSSPNPTVVRFRDLGAESGRQAAEKLAADLCVACAVLDEKPKNAFLKTGWDVFKAVFLFGVPIIVWPRKPGSTPAEQDERRGALAKLLASGALRDLPALLHQRRRESSCGPLGNCLTLVWDDPTWPIPEPRHNPLAPPTFG